MSNDTSNSPERNTSEHACDARDVQRYLRRAQDAGNWFTFRRDLVVSGLLTRDQALFLQDLINLSALPSAQWDGEYFLCTVEQLQQSLAWSSKSQKLLFRSLKRFVTTRKQGVPARRWVRVDLLGIEEAMDVQWGPKRTVQWGPKGPDWVGPKGPDYIKEGKDSKNTPSHRAKPRCEGVTVEQGSGDDTTLPGFFGNDDTPSSDPPGMGLARLLYEQLARRNKVVTTPNLRAWAKHMVPIEQSRGYSHVEEVIRWYTSNITEPYMPQAYCARTFATKLPNIESAMERQLGPGALSTHRGDRVKVTRRQSGSTRTTISDVEG